MEYNDSRVSDYKFENLEKDVTGDGEKSSNTYSYNNGWSDGGTYGKSAYMLFYERRKKKDMKVIIPEG